MYPNTTRTSSDAKALILKAGPSRSLFIAHLVIPVLISSRSRLIDSNTAPHPFIGAPGRRTFKIEKARGAITRRGARQIERPASSSDVFRPVVYVCCFVVQRLFRECFRLLVCLFHLLPLPPLEASLRAEKPTDGARTYDRPPPTKYRADTEESVRPV